MKNRKLNGSMTIEATVVMGVILAIFCCTVLALFYYHDKDVVEACAYEAAVVGSTKAHQEKQIDEGTVTALFEERIRGKCILFAQVSGSAEVTEEYVKVHAVASNGRMKVNVEERVSVTSPEKEIRSKRKLLH